MSGTIHYEGKIKRGKKPLEVFRKISKAIKKESPMEDWSCVIDKENEQLRISFSDKCEDFVLAFDEKGEFSDFCKVDFFDREDGMDELHALIDAIYNAESLFSRITVTDDYGLADDYWDSKRFKIQFRELTQEERERVVRLYSEGYTSHERVLMAIMAEDMEMSVEEMSDYINIDIPFSPVPDVFPKIFQTLGSYLHETAEYQNKGRLYEIPEYSYYISGSVSAPIFAFVEGLSWVFFDGTGYGTSISLEEKNFFNQKLTQIGLLFREKFVPEFVKLEDPLERCLLVYRYFVSVYDYAGFRYAGRAKNLKTVMDEIIEVYGEEKGTAFLTILCTNQYLLKCKHFSEEKYIGKFVENVKERYGQSLWDEYPAFEQKYDMRRNHRFYSEVQCVAELKLKYVDESLEQ